MRRDQREPAIRTACQIIERREVIVVGSQSIADDNDETARLADLIEGVAGVGHADGHSWTCLDREVRQTRGRHSRSECGSYRKLWYRDRRHVAD